ncbi:MAG: peptide chain release factor aRF-1 [Candidatus Micrarchaeota archaeon]|nr:peptide chain release factor aRF-1 [Candidatus Micrarchaeota archaeon]
MMGLKKEYETKKMIKRLASIRGSGTELISIYVPPDYQISQEIATLREEHSQSGNIKSKSTRLNVQGAIEKIMQHLKLYKSPPKNGLAIFCGNISNEQSKPDIEMFVVEPPAPIKSNIYRCDSSFLLEPIEAMLEAKELYGLLVMDGREATLGVLKGTQTIIEKKLRSFAHAKVRKGGQSANRYSRAIEESIDDYYKNVGDAVNDVFVKYGNRMKGIIVGGPGPAKENFIKAKTMNYQIKVIGVFDTGYTDEHTGINELMSKARDTISEQSAMMERSVMERFLNEVAGGGLATYGYQKVKNALLSGNIARLILSEDAELTNVQYKCTNCGNTVTALEQGNTRQTKHDCGGNLEILSQSDAVEELIELADKSGIDVVFVSSDSPYGKQLLLGFQGIAAMLKYRG